jgi:Flp pilus assembly protein TadG
MHMTRRWTGQPSLPHDERGQALMETAVTLPIILLVSIGIFEFGRAYQTWQVLTNAAREGARVAVLPGVNDAAVTARVQEYLTDGLIANPASADIDVTRDNEINIGAGTASASRVTVNYPYQFMVLEPVAQLINPSTTVGAPLTMSATSLMRNE